MVQMLPVLVVAEVVVIVMVLLVELVEVLVAVVLGQRLQVLALLVQQTLAEAAVVAGVIQVHLMVEMVVLVL